MCRALCAGVGSATRLSTAESHVYDRYSRSRPDPAAVPLPCRLVDSNLPAIYIMYILAAWRFNTLTCYMQKIVVVRCPVGVYVCLSTREMGEGEEKRSVSRRFVPR